MALLGCVSATDAPRREITLAVRADVTGFYPNPPTENEGYTQDINWNVLEGLTSFDGRYRLVPALASRWHNPDDNTYVFELRPGVRFSDGTPLTAEDVVASISAQRTKRWAFSDHMQSIESVDTDAAGRIVVRTRVRRHVLLYKLPWAMVLPRRVLEQEPVPVIGTGPYVLESWTPGEAFVMRRNRHYRGPTPDFDVARFEVEPDADRRIDRLLDGRADVIDHVPLERLDELERLDDVRVFSGPGNRVLFLGLRVDREPFSDPRVREALDLALDRQELIGRALAGRGLSASQVVAASVVGSNPDLEPTRPDRDRARALLAEAGWSGERHLTLDGPDNRYVNDTLILEEVARQLGEVGVRVDVRARSKNEFFASLVRGEPSFFLLGWACQTGEATEAYEPLFHSRTRDGLGGENHFGFADPAVDALIDSAGSRGDITRRIADLRAVAALVAAARPIVPLVIQPESVAMSRRIDWDPPMNYAFRLSSLRPARDE